MFTIKSNDLSHLASLINTTPALPITHSDRYPFIAASSPRYEEYYTLGDSWKKDGSVGIGEQRDVAVVRTRNSLERKNDFTEFYSLFGDAP